VYTVKNTQSGAYMNRILGFGRSIAECLKGLQFSALRSTINTDASPYNYFGFSKDEDMSRGLTMAKLHASLHTIQQGIDGYDIQIHILQASAKKKLLDKCDSSIVHAEWRKMRASQMHRRAAVKSQEIILCTIQSLIEQTRVQGMTNLMEFTVKQHHLAHSAGLTDDNQHEKLVEAYENISQSMTRNQDAMDTLDTEQSNLQQELDIDENQIQNQDSAFAKWTSEMQTESTPKSIPTLVNSQHDEANTAKQLKQKHQREQLDRSLQGAYGV